MVPRQQQNFHGKNASTPKTVINWCFCGLLDCRFNDAHQKFIRGLYETAPSSSTSAASTRSSTCT